MNAKISNKDMEKIIHDIINGVSKETGIKINVYPVTVSEYYSKYLKNKKCSLVKRINGLSAIFTRTLAFNDLTGNTVYFIDKINALSNSLEKCMFWVVNASYHEARHSIQQQFDSYSYEGFFRDVDNAILNSFMGKIDYNINHDRFFVEIDANRYGVYRTEKYLRERYPDIYGNFRKEIDKRINKYEFDYVSFDPVNEVDRIIKGLKTIEFPVHPFTVDIKEISPVLDIFLDNKYMFKPVKKIIRDKRFYKLDERVVFSFFASKSFLEQTNFSKLDYDELYVVNESLKEVKNFYENQFINMQKYEDDIDFVDKLKEKRTMIGKVAFASDYVKKMLHNNYGYLRNDIKMIEHRDNIDMYLNRTKQVIKRKNSRGFVFIDLFYVLGLIISVFVLIYLLSLR